MLELQGGQKRPMSSPLLTRRIFSRRLVARRSTKKKSLGVLPPDPSLRGCLGSLQEGDTLVLSSLDRFGGSLQELVKTLEDLRSKGVDFISLAEGIDTTEDQEGLFHVVGALAEFEQALAEERKIFDRQRAQLRGRYGGRPPALKEEDISKVQELMRDPEVLTTWICEHFDISKATLYRYVGPDGKRRK